MHASARGAYLSAALGLCPTHPPQSEHAVAQCPARNWAHCWLMWH